MTWGRWWWFSPWYNVTVWGVKIRKLDKSWTELAGQDMLHILHWCRVRGETCSSVNVDVFFKLIAIAPSLEWAVISTTVIGNHVQKTLFRQVMNTCAMQKIEHEWKQHVYFATLTARLSSPHSPVQWHVCSTDKQASPSQKKDSEKEPWSDSHMLMKPHKRTQNPNRKIPQRLAKWTRT